MKPTTEQILSALNEMIQSKTELKSEKIELALIDDIEKQSNKASAEFEELVKESKQVRKLVGRLTTGSILLRKSGEKLESMVNEMEKALKELGVDKPPKQFLVAKNLYKMFIKQGKRIYDQYGKLD
tara:strand:+ start:544 stop:921 length:378 start_codon:yes stop_codon:yes gene_type:complete